MKKYLITGSLALVACTWLVSCHDDADFGGKSYVAAKTEAFDNNFVKAYGQIAPNHDWGFGAYGAMARTRSGNVGSVIKPDEPTFPGYDVDIVNSRGEQLYSYPAPITTGEAAWVQNWFDNNPGLSEQGLDISNFFVQHVSNNGTTKNGYFWTNEGSANGEITKTYDTYEDAYMDKLQIGPERSEAGTLHALDYNATSGLFNLWNVIYIQGGSALQFGYHETYGESYQWKFKCVELTVPGENFPDGVARKGWYVGLSYYCNKVEVEGVKGDVLGEATVNYANDWILKIVPGETTTTTIPEVMVVNSSPSSYADYEVWKRTKVTDIGRVMAEDLGSAQKLDMDYNDVVFEARIVSDFIEIWATLQGETSASPVSSVTFDDGTSYSATESNTHANIKLLAAGGTIPLTVAGVDVHNQFDPNLSVTTMINTRNPEMTNGTYAERPATDLTSTNNTIPTDFPIVSIDAIEIAAQYMNEPIIVNNNGDSVNVPHKIRVPVDARWPIERIEMNTAYDGYFGGVDGKVGYVQSPTVPFWTHAIEGKTNYLAGFGTPTGTILSETKLKSGRVYGGESVNVGSLVPATNTTMPTVETGWTTAWSRSDSNPGYLYTDNSGVHTVTTGNVFSNVNNGTKIRVYGVYNGTPSINVSAGNTSLGNASYNYQGGYYEFTIDSDAKATNVNTYGLNISGSNFTVTDVAYLPLATQERYSYTLTSNEQILWQAYPITNATTFTNDWGGSVQISRSDFVNKNPSVGSIIRIYGEPLADDWMVKITDNTWGDHNIFGGGDTDCYWSNSNASDVTTKKYVEFTLNDYALNSVFLGGQNDKIIVQGKNFDCYCVTIDNSEVDVPEETPVVNPPSGGGTTIWYRGSDYAYQELVSASTLSQSGLVSTKTATLIVTGTHNANSWGVNCMAGWSSFFAASHSNNSEYGDCPNLSEEGGSIVVTIPLSMQNIANILSSEGLRVQYDNITLSRIEIKQ